MALHTLDVLGLKCPQPVLKVAAMAKSIPAGDCESFPKDIEAWCARMKKTLLFCADQGGGKFKAQIQF